MAKVSSVQKNLRRQKMTASLAKKRAALKAKIYDKKLDLGERFALVTKLAALPRNSARTRIRNRCELTGRSRGYYRKFKLGRNMLRALGNSGLIPGLIKSSW